MSANFCSINFPNGYIGNIALVILMEHLECIREINLNIRRHTTVYVTYFGLTFDSWACFFFQY